MVLGLFCIFKNYYELILMGDKTSLWDNTKQIQVLSLISYPYTICGGGGHLQLLQPPPSVYAPW